MKIYIPFLFLNFTFFYKKYNSKKGIKALVAEQKILNKIYIIRGQKVMIDEDLSEIYGVETKRLNEQVKRNIKRFPKDFMFEISKKEFEILKSHFATSSWGGLRKLPYAFSEKGVAMLSSILCNLKAQLNKSHLC
ncbi:MAG: ORF6N domain-containing protein [Sphingobacteriia bacterium]